MENLLSWILIGIAAISAVCLLPYIPYLLYGVMRLCGESITNFQDTFLSGLRDISEERSLSRLRQEMQKRVEKHMAARGFRHAFRGGREEVETYAATALLKETVGACCDIHHYTADVRNVAHMRELQDHLICNAHRTRVVDTLEFVLDAVAQKDLAGNVIQSKMAVGIEAMHDICINCMLLRFGREEVPRLCDPAKFMGCEDNNPEAANEPH